MVLVDDLENFQDCHPWYRVMPLFQPFAYAYIASSCEHNCLQFQWMILKTSRIVTHSTQLCLKAGYFYSFFPYRVMPLFQLIAYAYIANSCEHNSLQFQWMILKTSRIVTHGTELCPFFQLIAYVYIANSCKHNSYGFSG